jgi:uncharacterized protein
MKNDLRDKLIKLAKSCYGESDPSHSFSHIERVLLNAEIISKTEPQADLEIIIPAVLFHDAVTYAKDDPRNKFSTEESANKAEAILVSVSEYPQNKIQAVKECIIKTSFSKGLKAETIEQKILQDSDMLEATGAISIMRTFTTGGIMKRDLYNTTDPFVKNREPEDFKYSLDLFYSRLLKVEARMNTTKSKEIASRRTKFLYDFLNELKLEINEGK